MSTSNMTGEQLHSFSADLPQGEKVLAEYVWIGDAHTTSGFDIRCKTKTLNKAPESVADLPIWNYDGSPGDNSGVLLKPCSILKCPFRGGQNILVMCETMTPLPTKTSNAGNKIFEANKAEEPLFGIEQEYTLYEKDNLTPLGWPKNGFPGAQGPYYCSAGTDVSYGRTIADSNYKACIYAGINQSGINAELVPGQTKSFSICASKFNCARCSSSCKALARMAQKEQDEEAELARREGARESELQTTETLKTELKEADVIHHKETQDVIVASHEHALAAGKSAVADVNQVEKKEVMDVEMQEAVIATMIAKRVEKKQRAELQLFLAKLMARNEKLEAQNASVELLLAEVHRIAQLTSDNPHEGFHAAALRIAEGQVIIAQGKADNDFPQPSNVEIEAPYKEEVDDEDAPIAFPVKIGGESNLQRMKIDRSSDAPNNALSSTAASATNLSQEILTVYGRKLEHGEELSVWYLL